MYQQLESVIEKHYSTMSKKDILECSQEFCNHFMIQTNSILQTNLNRWDDNKVRDYAIRVQDYADINSAILTLRTGTNDQKLITKGRIKADELFDTIKKEFEPEFSSAGSARQKQITDEIYLPHISFLWLFKRY
jgi:hypothetical protein